MNDAWRNYRSAPPTGTQVLRASEIGRNQSRCVSVESDNGRFPLVMVRDGEGILHAWVNACPHQYLPLNGRGENILSRDGDLLICTSHQATFRVDTGEGVSGPAQGKALDPVPVAEDDGGWLVIGGA